jgi:hypothetical protein
MAHAKNHKKSLFTYLKHDHSHHDSKTLRQANKLNSLESFRFKESMSSLLK